jgi:hypothetical protein
MSEEEGWTKHIRSALITEYFDQHGHLCKYVYSGLSNHIYICYFNKDKKEHREDGPARSWETKEKASSRNKQIPPEWWYHGKYLEHISSQLQFEQWLKLKAFW